MAFSNREENLEDRPGDVENSSDFSYSVLERSSDIKSDLRRSVMQGSDADSGITVSGVKSIKIKLYCDLCREDKKLVPAEGFCVNCNEYLCMNCFDFHRKQKTLKLHVLKDKCNMPQDRDAVNPIDACVDKCSTHTDKLIEYFCHSCDQLGCSACIVTGHRACKDVDFVPDIVANMENSEESKQVKNTVQHLSQKLVLHKNRVVSNIEQSNAFRKKAKEKIVKQRQEIDSIFDRKENDMYAEIDEIYNDDQVHLTTASDLINSLTDKVSDIYSDLCSSSRNRCQLFVATKMAKKRMNAIERDVDTLKSANKVHNFQYNPKSQLQDELANIEIGKIKSVSSETTKRRVSSRSIDVSCKEDINETRTRIVTGACLIPNCRIAVIDSHRDTCKLVDLRTEQVISFSKFDCQPFDVTNVSENEIAVTFPVEGKLKLVMVCDDASLIEQKTFDVGAGCCGVHYFNRKYVIAFKKCLGGRPRIDIIDLQGQLLKSIENDNRRTPLFKSAYYVTVSPDGATLYVTERNKKSVICLSMDGQILGIYMMESSSYGIAVDETGSVFVCMTDLGTYSSILQLSDDCESAKTLFKVDRVFLSAITYCNENQSFFMPKYEQPEILVVKTENVDKDSKK
ncbi:uncharacterized protein LOC132739136 [Ruditapes philippinarum]|uniref:uncharacterized protein LOC132739136 n=1 Tax=Ruditapes philippinarum TaxID=129788 RepID=UPI00295B3A52|nr:uncharacterized protein LOC132739136 [Ruditapes philippinarum]